MDKQNYENEFAQINKIIECQNTSSSKEALLLANYSKEKYPRQYGKMDLRRKADIGAPDIGTPSYKVSE